MSEKTVKYWLDRVRNELLTENQQKLYDEVYNNGTYNGDTFSDFIPYKTKELCNDNLSVTLAKDYGGEDCGSDYWYVFKIVDKVTNKEVYVKFNGSYDSYNGVDWNDEAFLVEPKEKTIIVYEEIKND